MKRADHARVTVAGAVGDGPSERRVVWPASDSEPGWCGIAANAAPKWGSGGRVARVYPATGHREHEFLGHRSQAEYGRFVRILQRWRQSDTFPVSTYDEDQLIVRSTREVSVMTYDLFLSYAHHDEAIVAYLREQLLGHVSVWFDSERLYAGGNIDRVIDAIQESEVFLAWYSTTYWTRPYCKKELEEALRLVGTNFEHGRLLIFNPECSSDHVHPALRSAPSSSRSTRAIRDSPLTVTSTRYVLLSVESTVLSAVSSRTSLEESNIAVRPR
jgi:hypothetical protein